MNLFLLASNAFSMVYCTRLSTFPSCRNRLKESKIAFKAAGLSWDRISPHS